jgi:hypothetical protein
MSLVSMIYRIGQHAPELFQFETKGHPTALNQYCEALKNRLRSLS